MYIYRASTVPGYGQKQKNQFGPLIEAKYGLIKTKYGLTDAAKRFIIKCRAKMFKYFCEMFKRIATN